MKIVLDHKDLYRAAVSLYVHEQKRAKPKDKKYKQYWYDTDLTEWIKKAEAVVEGLNRE